RGSRTEQPVGGAAGHDPNGDRRAEQSDDGTASAPGRVRPQYRRSAVRARGEPGRTAAAVNAVGGAVAGFSRLADGDGFYFVQIPDDGTGEPLFAAIETLAAFPAVQWAGPEVILQVNLEDAFDSSPSHGPDREERARPLPPTQP